MKTLRLLLCVLVLSGCSTMSAVNWSAAWPWNWFGTSIEVNEQGVGELTAQTPLNKQAIGDVLGGDYRLRGGMKTSNGEIVRYFEALKDEKLALTINGEGGTISRIEVRDSDIAAVGGVKIGTPFSELYRRAFGNCENGDGVVECKAPGSRHISYVFSGQWRGPQALMPSDDTLKSWTVSEIIWQR